MSENQISQNYYDEEISLIDLLAVLFKYRKLIILITGIAFIAAVLFSVISIKLPADISPLPNTYTSTTSAFVNETDTESPQKNSALAVYYATQNNVLDLIVQKFDLINKWKIKDKQISTSREMLKKNLKVEYNKDSGVFTISYTSTDPQLAFNIVSFLLKKVQEMLKDNEQQQLQQQLLQQQLIQNSAKAQINIATEKMQALPEGSDKENAQSELNSAQQIYLQAKADVELTNAKIETQQDILKISNPAEIPEKKVGPSRSKICIIVIFAAFFISVFTAFLLNAIENIKKDPEAMEKFKD